MEAIAQQVVAVLGLAGFDLLGELRVHGDAELSAGVEGFAKALAGESGFETGGAKDGLLGQGDALKGEEFLGVDGVVEVDQVFPEVGDLIEVFEANDGEAGRDASGPPVVRRRALGMSILAHWGCGWRLGGPGWLPNQEQTGTLEPSSQK
jgi:hypothetical protein